MAVIVRHEDKENERYVLLGTGFGMFKTTRRFTLGDIFTKDVKEGVRDVVQGSENEGECSLAALCGIDGRILWADTSKLTVISVDGQSPQGVLADS